MNRWEGKPGYWKRTKYDGYVTDVWYPYHLRKRPGKLYEDEHIVNHVQHNLGVTDGYCAFYRFVLDSGLPVMTEWDRGETTPYYEELYPDAVMKLFGVKFFDEYECGQHPIVTGKTSDKYWKKSFNFKMSRYMNYLSRHPDTYLLIRVEKWLGRKRDRRGTDELFDDYLDYLETIGNRDRILIARNRDVVGDTDGVDGEIHHDDLGDPLGQVWYSPDDPIDPVSIQQLLRTSNQTLNHT